MDRIDPMGGLKDDFRTALIAHLLVNIAKSVHGKRGVQMSSIRDFIVDWETWTVGKPKVQSVEEMKSILLAMAKRNFKKVDKNDLIRRKKWREGQAPDKT